MKKIILLSFLSALCLSMAAQNWCPPGATWYYTYGANIADIDGIIEFKYSADTVINTITCKKISGTFIGKKPLSTNNYTVIPNFKNYYSYENNGVVYLYTGASFDTVVNYNAIIGDKWLRPQLPFSNCPNSALRGPLLITDTGHVMINNVNLRKIVGTYTASYVMSSTVYTYPAVVTFIEKIYSYSDNNYPPAEMFPLYCDDNSALYDGPIISFRCYQDNNFALYSTIPYGCNSLTGIETAEGNISGFNLHPNPANNTLHIENAGLLNGVTILNTLGQTVIGLSGPQTVIDVSALQPGVYYLEAQNEKGRKACKFIKE